MAVPHSPQSPPRVLHLDLAQLGVNESRVLEPEPFLDPEAGLHTLGGLGGSGLALALLARAERGGRQGALVLAVGGALRRGLPTAARLSAVARSPLTGGLAEGLAGGPAALRLGRLADGLVVVGPPALGADVVQLLQRPDGSVLATRRRWADFAALDVPGRRERLAECVGDPSRASALLVGPAAADRPLGGAVAFAHLAAAELDGQKVPTRTGRGGLGRVLGRLGVGALVLDALVLDADALSQAPPPGELLAALAASPRLRARRDGGTLELWQALAARGEVPRDLAERLGAEVRAAARDRQGCRGCPTPCGLVFDVPGGAGTPAHFGASSAFVDLAPGRTFAGQLELLAEADRLGLDALELARVLELDGVSAADALGRIRDLAQGHRTAVHLATGAAALGRLRGRMDQPLARGMAWRREASRTARAAAALVGGGTDPLRAFSALVEGAELGALARLAPPLSGIDGIGDPADPRGKGQLLGWFEDLAAASDASGFCAFSAAALLTDGPMDLDTLARESAADFAADGRGFADAGARVAFARALLDAFVGGIEELGSGRPRAVGPEVDVSTAAEYAAWRGLDAGLVPSAAARARFAAGDVPGRQLDFDARPPVQVRREGLPATTRAGRVELRGGGLAERDPAGALVVGLELPATLEQVLRRAAQLRPGAPLFDAAGLPLPSAWRDGQRVFAADWLHDGDRVDLVLALGGG
ncbi:MAG: hypothetical protein GC161_10010 [Planctomycetaceae bacterium]|nr:hypothetical protein [Planctomycetaceae bacterium]